MNEQTRVVVDDIWIFPALGGDWMAEPNPASAYPPGTFARAATPERALFWLVEQIEKDDRIALPQVVRYTTFPF